MTKQTTDEGTILDQDTPAPITVTDEVAFIEELDPMIEEMKAAEAEIAATGGDKGEAEPQGNAQPEAPAQGAKATSPMIPKARLDEVLSENALLRDQVGYMRGVIDANAKAPKAAQPEAPKTEGAEQPQTNTDPVQGNAVDVIETQIEAAEKKKLELAERYDEGEISSKQWKEQELAIDKEIRGLLNQKFDKAREEGRNEIQAALTAQQAREYVDNTALNLQKAHPNVAVIDSLSPGVRDGVWADITAKASANLAAQGIDVRLAKADPRVHAALVKEKARLTDDLGSFLPGYAAQPAAQPTQQPANGGTPVQKKPSEKAQNLAAKIDLANSQPPSTADMGRGANNGELTEEQVANMTEDQMADLLATAPHLVKRIMGQAN